MELYAKKLTQLMDIRQSINSIPDSLKRFYKPVTSRAWINGRTPYTDTIWVVDMDAVRAHFANRPEPVVGQEVA